MIVIFDASEYNWYNNHCWCVGDHVISLRVLVSQLAVTIYLLKFLIFRVTQLILAFFHHCSCGGRLPLTNLASMALAEYTSLWCE